MNKNILFMAILGSFVLLQDIGAGNEKGLTAKAKGLAAKAASLPKGLAAKAASLPKGLAAKAASLPKAASLKERAKSVAQNLVTSVPLSLSNFI